jgi:hypothetical protein
VERVAVVAFALVLAVSSALIAVLRRVAFRDDPHTRTVVRWGFTAGLAIGIALFIAVVALALSLPTFGTVGIDIRFVFAVALLLGGGAAIGVFLLSIDLYIIGTLLVRAPSRALVAASVLLAPLVLVGIAFSTVQAGNVLVRFESEQSQQQARQEQATRGRALSVSATLVDADIREGIVRTATGEHPGKVVRALTVQVRIRTSEALSFEQGFYTDGRSNPHVCVHPPEYGPTEGPSVGFRCWAGASLPATPATWPAGFDRIYTLSLRPGSPEEETFGGEPGTWTAGLLGYTAEGEFVVTSTFEVPPSS